MILENLLLMLFLTGVKQTDINTQAILTHLLRDKVFGCLRHLPWHRPPLLIGATSDLFIAGSGDNTQPGPPVAYSEDPSSSFYQMVKAVYDASQTLTTDQTNMALYWRDLPGLTAAGHWLSILQEVLKKTNSRLDKAALAYAVTGTCLSDASISCWQTKYHYNLVRPITYIQNVLGHTSWASVLTTPAHPEYSSAHCAIS